MKYQEKHFLTCRLEEFWKNLYQTVESMERCEKNIADALAVVQDDLGLGKVVMMLETPDNRFNMHGRQRYRVLLDRSEKKLQEMILIFNFMTGGTLTFRIMPLEEEFGKERIEEIHGIFREIFYWYDRNMQQHFMKRIINTDLDTEAANQYAFKKRAGSLLEQGIIGNYCVVFFNIHNFKYVNKVFSYAEGDQILKKYVGQVKKMMDSGEIMARLGGDNFVALVKKEGIHRFVQELQEMTVVYENTMKSKKFLFGATIGASTLEGIHEVREVMLRASIAYQEARRCKVGGIVWFSEEIRQKMMETQSIISNFRHILEEGGFVVYYQPKVHCVTKKICGAEALVRWIREGELVPPGMFIPQLEQEGSICRLDYYVLEQVCRFLKQREESGKSNICISVNFSRKHLEEDDFVGNIISIIDHYGVQRNLIEVELTESEDFQQYGIMSSIVNELKKKGIKTSIDDFGTGFSSLNMLKKVDLDIVKIDKSFIPREGDYCGKEQDMFMLWSIAGMLRQLGKSMVAEGVETREQLKYLEKTGCHVIQGYLFDKPLPQEVFEERLKEEYIYSC